LDWNSLLNNTLDGIHSHLENIHAGTVRKSHEVMARGVEKVTAARRVEIEEDSRHNDNLLSEAGLEKVETIRNGLRETFEIKPTGND
jgi:hypothetical protein